MKRIGLIVLTLVVLVGTNAEAFFLNVQPVTTYTDNTAIDNSDLPVTYDIWFVDYVTLTRTDVCTRCLTTSSTFSDASMISGRLYMFYGKAYVQSGATSEDSTGYDWVVSFRMDMRGGSIHGGILH